MSEPQYLEEVDAEPDGDLAYLLPPIRQGDRVKPNENPWFDDWLGAGGPCLKRLVADVRRSLAEQEDARGLRKRARRAADLENCETAVEVVVSNLARASLMDAERRELNLITGRKLKGFSRYDNKALGKPFLELLDALGALGMLVRRRSYKRGIASSLQPTEGFQALVRDGGVAPGDFRQIPAQEAIELRRKKKIRQYGQESERIETVDYVDNPDTIRMRKEMQEINNALALADITFIDDDKGTVDTLRRSLRRVFVMRHDDPRPQRFDQGGRLFGGFWQGLERKRRRQIRIEGETAAYLDYASMFLRLVYAQAGVQPPDGDLYAIPGLEGHRAAVKVAVNALLFAGRKRTNWPRIEATEDEPPPGFTWSQFLAGFAQVHPAVMPYTGKGLGLGLMFLESEIMVKVLIRLTDEGVVALPIHDGLMVKASRKKPALRAMEEVAREITSADIPVKVTLL